MNRIIKILLVLLTCAPIHAVAQSALGYPSSRKFSEPIYFRLGASTIDLDYEGNRARMDTLLSRLNRVLADPTYVVSRVVVTGTASPDGKEDVNIALAGQRSRQLADYLLKHTSLPAHIVEVVNGGENWSGLRVMIEESQMPYKSAMLGFMDRYATDRDKRKSAMQFYADSEPWLWMYQHLFPALRMGAGGSQGHPELNLLSLRNWDRMREIISSLPVTLAVRKQMLHVLDTEPDGVRRLKLIHDICSPGTYVLLQRKLFAALLSEPSVLSEDNWTLLWERLNASGLPHRDQMLRIIDNVPILEGREQQLKALDGGKPYQTLLADYFSELLTAGRISRVEPFSVVTDTMTLGTANWLRLSSMIEASDLPGRELALAVIRGSADPAIRERLLREVGNGDAYQYISEVLFPELLYGLSAAAQENWILLTDQIRRSDMPHKDEILHLIATLPAGQEREEAIRNLDNGESWQRLGEMLLPKLLAGTETVANGSGVSVYYELSPAARARATAVVRRRAAETATQPAVTEEPVPAVVPQAKRPLLALQTDLLLWGGVMPSFKMGSWTPNLSLEFYFSRRWSVQAGYAYSNWNALSGDNRLYALSIADLEVRYWLGKPSQFKGFYLGLYGQYGQYDVERDALSGNTGTFYTGGLGAGYLLPLSRCVAFGLEVRGGYRPASDESYDVEEGHSYRNNDRTVGTFVPQVRLQFMYRFGKSTKK